MNSAGIVSRTAVPRLFRAVLIAILLAAWGVPAEAQDRSPTVTLNTIAQQFEVGDTETLKEIVTEVGVKVPVGSRFEFGVVARGAQVGGGPDFDAVSGLGDVRVAANYTRSIGDNELVLGVVSYLPTGKQELTRTEFATTAVLSRDIYGFRMPSFGQGLQVAPRLAFVAPFGDNLVVGLTSSWRYFGGYTPQAGMPEPYEPGGLFRNAIGVDYRLTPTSALSADVSYVAYGTDRIGGEKRLSLGNLWVATVQYLNRFGYNQVRAIVRYQDRRQSTLFNLSGRTGPADLRIRPRESFAQVGYRFRIVPDVYTTVRARGSLFRETARRPQAYTGRVRIRPEYRIADQWSLTALVGGVAGDIRGIEGGIGISYQPPFSF